MQVCLCTDCVVSECAYHNRMGRNHYGVESNAQLSLTHRLNTSFLWPLALSLLLSVRAQIKGFENPNKRWHNNTSMADLIQAALECEHQTKQQYIGHFSTLHLLDEIVAKTLMSTWSNAHSLIFCKRKTELYSIRFYGFLHFHKLLPDWNKMENHKKSFSRAAGATRSLIKTLSLFTESSLCETENPHSYFFKRCFLYKSHSDHLLT